MSLLSIPTLALPKSGYKGQGDTAQSQPALREHPCFVQFGYIVLLWGEVFNMGF